MICFVIDCSSSCKKQDGQMDYEVIEETPTWQLILRIQQSAVKYILFDSTEFDAHGFSSHVVLG